MLTVSAIINNAGIYTAGQITTGNPSGAAAACLFGDVQTASVTLDTAHYWEVKVGSTVKKILVAN
jgi:hypothetical protein